MEYVIIEDIDANDLYNLRKILGWKEISKAQLEKGLKNSMCKVSIKNNNEIIALGRIVGDYSCKGVLSDILVHPNYQSKGFGKKIVTNLLNQIQSKLQDNETFQIEATPTAGNREFYVKCGLKYKPENQDGVYVWLKK